MSEEKKQASDEVKDEEKKEGGKVDVEVIEGEKGGDEKPVEGDAKVEEEKVVEKVDAPVDGDAKVEEEKVDAPVDGDAKVEEEKVDAPVDGDAKVEEEKVDEKVDAPVEIRPGMTLRIHERIKELNTKGEEKQRIQYFEGLVIAKKHGQEVGGTVTLRKVSNGVGVEKIFPLNMPTITKIELKKVAQVRRAKLGYLRRGYKKRLSEKRDEKVIFDSEEK